MQLEKWSGQGVQMSSTGRSLMGQRGRVVSSASELTDCMPGGQESETDSGPRPGLAACRLWAPPGLGFWEERVSPVLSVQRWTGRTSRPGLPPLGSWRFESEVVFRKPVSTAEKAPTGPSLVAAGETIQEARAQVFPVTSS